MMVLQHIQSAISQFGEQIEIPGLSLDENGVLNLVLDDDDVLGLEAQGTCVFVSVAVVMQDYELAFALDEGFKEVYLALENNNIQLCMSLKQPQITTKPSAIIFTANILNSDVGADSIFEMIDLLWGIRLRLKQLD